MAHSYQARYPTSKGRSRGLACLTLTMVLFIGGERRASCAPLFHSPHSSSNVVPRAGGIRSSEGMRPCAWEGAQRQHDWICPPPPSRWL